MSERLPSTDDEVLVYMYDSLYLAWVDRNGNWYTNSFNIEVEDYPKYWMLLPEPPKEE